MVLSRRFRILVASCAVFGLAALPAYASKQLPIKVARERAASFAESICAHDKSCARAGVRDCRRVGDNVVICRIYDHRKTEEQGSFICTRLVRLALEPGSGRVPVTGVSDWDC